MRRRLSIATFLLLLASVPVAAQHGAVHAGGGHAGFSGGHAGSLAGRPGFSGVHVSGGMRSGPGVSRGFTPTPSFSQRGVMHRSIPNGGSHGRHIRTHGFRNNCYGYGCRGLYFYPYAYSGFYDPYWWWDSNSSGYQNYDEDYERNRALANEMNQQSLEEQRMRRQDEDKDNDQDRYNRASYARLSPAPRDPESEAAQLTTVLIFRDQHKQEVRNYAIVGQTLWSFGSPRTEKIPLADLDLAATTKVNEDRGLTFRVPAPNQAQ